MTKAEGRKKPEQRRPNTVSRYPSLSAIFRALGFVVLSDFVIRISDFLEVAVRRGPALRLTLVVRWAGPTVPAAPSPGRARPSRAIPASAPQFGAIRRPPANPPAPAIRSIRGTPPSCHKSSAGPPPPPVRPAPPTRVQPAFASLHPPSRRAPARFRRG